MNKYTLLCSRIDDLRMDWATLVDNVSWVCHGLHGSAAGGLAVLDLVRLGPGGHEAELARDNDEVIRRSSAVL
jgi:hypothetical protein